MNLSNSYQKLNWTRSGSDFLIDKEYKLELIQKIKKYIYKDNLEKVSIDNLSYDVMRIIEAYNKMVKAFEWKYRKISGERYFEHLREVANIILRMPKPNIDKIIIALYHDSIEDLEKYTFEVVKDETWSEKIAIAVEAISKKKWESYSNNETEWKRLRNEDYFWKLKSFDKMKWYVKLIAKKKSINLTDKELEEITLNIFYVKFADRIHNLRTQWCPNDINQVKKKIKETKEYFLINAKRINIKIYKKLFNEIVKLETELVYDKKDKDKEYEINQIFNITKWVVIKIT